MNTTMTGHQNCRRWLLMAAIGRYQSEELDLLPGVIDDAKRLTDVLDKFSILPTAETIPLFDDDATLAQILAALRRLAIEVKPGDQLVFYFAGHGRALPGGKAPQPDGLTRYILPFDAAPDDLAATAITSRDLAHELSQVPVNELVVLLDCCSSAGFTEVLIPQIEPPQVDMRSRVLIAAAHGTQAAYENRRGGVFTQHFCDALEGKVLTVVSRDGRVTAAAAFQHAEESMRDLTGVTGQPLRPTARQSGGSVYLTRVPSQAQRSRNLDLVLLLPIESSFPERLQGDHPQHSWQPLPLSAYSSTLVVEHPRVRDILSTVRRRQIALIVGPIGAGKSTLARALCLRAQQHFDSVLWLPPQRVLPHLLPFILQELENIAPSTLLLLEDIHRFPELYNAIYGKAREQGVHLLITTRPSYQSEVYRHDPLQLLTIEDASPDLTFHIAADDIIDELMRRHEKARSLSLSPTMRMQLINRSKGNLWVLNAHLRHLSRGTAIDFASAEKEILRELRDEFADLPNALEIYLIVSAVYQYELPLPIAFLTVKKRLPEATVQGLLKKGVLQRAAPTDAVYLAHAAQARLFLQIALESALLPELAEKYGRPTEAIAGLILEYLQFAPSTIPMVIQRIRYDADLLHVLATDTHFMTLIGTVLNGDNVSTLKLAHLLSDFTRVTNEFTRKAIVAEIDEAAIVKRLNGETHLNAIAAFLDGFPWCVQSLAHDLVQQVNLAMRTHALAMNEAHKTDVGFCEWMVRLGPPQELRANLRATYERYPAGKTIPVAKLNVARTAFCSKNAGSGDLIMCGKSVLVQPEPTSVRIVHALDTALLAVKIDASNDLYAVAHILDMIAWIDHTTAESVLSKLNYAHLVCLINEEQEARLSCLAAWVLWRISPALFFDRIEPSVQQRIREQLCEAQWFKETGNVEQAID